MDDIGIRRGSLRKRKWRNVLLKWGEALSDCMELGGRLKLRQGFWFGGVICMLLSHVYLMLSADYEVEVYLLSF